MEDARDRTTWKAIIGVQPIPTQMDDDNVGLFAPTAFNEPHLDKKPETRVYRPPQGQLSRALNPLSQQEEARVVQILSELASTVQRRRLMCFPHFKDYDRVIKTQPSSEPE